MFKKKRWLALGIVPLLVALVILPFVSAPAKVSITGDGKLAIESYVAIAAQTEAVEFPDKTVRYSSKTTVTEEPWGYKYILENGDTVEVGDSTTVDFKAHVKTIRWNGVADFSLWLDGGTFIPTLEGNTVSFNFNDSISIKIYPVAPCERLLEGGIEYNITLLKRLAKPTVTFNIDWNGVTWTKLLPLDEEHDQDTCIEEWGVELAPFTIIPTSITSDVTSEVLLTRAEYKVNSYIGEATTNWHNTSDMGNNVLYSTVSRSYLHIHRGIMTDNLGDTAWIEDINLNEAKKEIAFTLPKTWLKNASYPVHQVCGVDPAYTEDMDTFGPTLTEGAWTDYDIFTEKGTPKNSVVEIIISNDDAGKEYLAGVRTDGSSLERKLALHEAEGGGATTVRLFALVDASTGLIETYQEENTDIIFTIVGYWENVGFTERWDDETPDTSGAWDEEELVDTGAASRVCHMLLRNQEADTYNSMGVRNTEFALARTFPRIHEPEGGGESLMDMLVKADANYKVDFKTDDNANTVITNAGYFGSELDFVELFQVITNDGDGDWDALDLTPYLDEDGRVCDFLLSHRVIDAEHTLGVRDGDDSTTNRYILEHESEDNGSSTSEGTGFGISAKSNASGVVNLYSSTTQEGFYLMGYFKPVAVGEADISNAPSSKAFGVVSNSITYWSNGSEPTWPLVDGDAYFTITNNGDTCSITIVATNFTGGVGWTLGTPAENTVRVTAFKEGDGSGDGITLTTSPQSFITALSTNIDWELKMETPTSYTDGAEKTSILTLAATLD